MIDPQKAGEAARIYAVSCLLRGVPASVLESDRSLAGRYDRHA